MMTPQLAWSIRTEFGHSINPHDGPFSCVRLKEVALRADTLRAELQDLDDELRDMAEPPTPPDVQPTIGNIVLRPSPSLSRAAAVLRRLRLGQDVEVDCLEVLDEVLMSLGAGEEPSIISTKGPMTVETAKRLRFERGFEVRPPLPDTTSQEVAGHVETGGKA